MLRFPYLPLMLTALVPAATRAADSPALDPNLPCQARRTNPVTYEVDFAVVVTPPAHTRLLKVWIPIPPSTATQQVAGSSLSSFPVSIDPRRGREPVFGNSFACFEFPNPQGAQMVRHRFTVTVHELHWALDPAQVTPVEHWPLAFAPYLRSDRSVVVDDRFRDLARTIVPDRQGPARDLAGVLAWAERTLRYDHAAASLTASAERALLQKRGHCSDYHGLCAALGRALGTPTRVAYGLHTLPKNSPSHCKLEAFLPPYGWVSFDVSETQKLVESLRKDPQLSPADRERLVQAAADRLRRGFQDNTWFLQTRGTDYDLAPPASRKVPVVRTAWIEADGVPLPDPDPANPARREFAWMTLLRCQPDRPVTFPFQDARSLAPRP